MAFGKSYKDKILPIKSFPYQEEFKSKELRIFNLIFISSQSL